ncbi:hypothetical protein JHK82_026644 [Glycine max]|uniref:Uncharacterized protein n=2 Tax=Glycine subgen. Soja TaxID=1462606 RepID=K7LGW4_SOYBN|nr:hypothetical protein JHK87_026528 [Glycine soja]KAG4995824.1 hypothetical protein JHK85_027263 [Glycine max]KAG5125809.1 hypothetical protein JHK82_026644 [Glycine max]KAG5150407.1 hypothetical protein JHK84_026879 [Glycine max]RZB85212.1 hypothetical protein D0Y65_025719 [Glycine soja]
MIVILCRRQRTSSEPSISLSPLSRRDLEAFHPGVALQELVQNLHLVSYLTVIGDSHSAPSHTSIVV